MSRRLQRGGCFSVWNQRGHPVAARMTCEGRSRAVFVRGVGGLTTPCWITSPAARRGRRRFRAAFSLMRLTAISARLLGIMEHAQQFVVVRAPR